MELSILKANLKERGYRVAVFQSGEEAAAYLGMEIKGTSVGFGGSTTLKQLGLYEVLAAHNAVFWHSAGITPKEREEQLRLASGAEVYISSVNGISLSGEIVNIDGIGNRVSNTLYGHRRYFFLVGRNKVAPSLEAAIDRARNVAAPKNAARLGKRTPCAVSGHCHDCSSPDRICRELSVLWRAPMQGEYEVVLINEELGF